MRRPPRTRRPGRIPRAEPLEPRALLSLGATWLGQDGSDFAGRSSPVSDGLADIHIRVSGLDPGTPLGFVDIQPLGGGLWRSDGRGADLVVVRPGPAADQVDLYFNPYQTDPGRPYQIDLSQGESPTTTVWLTGGPVDGNLRLDSARIQAAWLGQQGTDRVGPRNAVGPDGFADARISLSNLSVIASVRTITITEPGGERWSWGPDNSGAWEVDASFDGTSALVSMGFDRNPEDVPLSIRVGYSDNSTDTVVVRAGAVDPGLPIDNSASLPALTWGAIRSTWLGQDGQGSRRGDVHLRIDGLPTGRAISSASLGDLAGYSWAWKGSTSDSFYTDAYARGLDLARPNGSTSADLFFDPVRDESGSSMTLRLLLDDGSTWLDSVSGGFADPALRAPSPISTSTVAHPGDDLSTMANQYGHVHLTAGNYALSSPLVLTRAVAISADPGAVLLFRQPAMAAPWTAAIKILAGNTSLEGFSVRFDGPIRWNSSVNYGPAVIGLRDNLDPPATSPMVGITLQSLDLQGPPADPSGATWQEAIDLIRLAGGEGGTIKGNILQGGPVEFLYGPWTITHNTSQGTMPGTYSFGVFIGHATHDLVLSNNLAQPIAGSGKTWRFLVLTVGGYNDTIRGNSSVGIGPKDGDTIPDMNAAEVVLTESYRIAYEGSVASVSGDGRVVRIFEPQAAHPQSGDAMAVLDGPGSGQYRRILMVLDPTTVLLDAPLPSGTSAVSIATGFIGTTFDNNTIDCRGGSAACDLVLGGNLFGVVVTGNKLLGGAPFQITAAPTESPVRWGWSEAPALGLSIVGNTFQDNARAGVLGVNRLSGTRMASGRTYVSASFRDNSFVIEPGSNLRRLMNFGDDSALDAGEVQLELAGNRLASASGGSDVLMIHIGAATIGGQAIRSIDIPLIVPLPAPVPFPILPSPPGLSLVNDTGPSSSDGITNDPTIRIQPATGAVSFEYRVEDQARYLPVNALTIRPADLTDGFVTIHVRSVTEGGIRGPDASIRFLLRTAGPPAVSGLALNGSSVVFGTVVGASGYQYWVEGRGNLVDLANSTNFTVPDLGSGVFRVAVRAIDLAGNAGPESWLTIDRTPAPSVLPRPPLISATWMGQDGRDLVGPSPKLSGDGQVDAHIRLTNLTGVVARFELRALGANGTRWRSDGKSGLPRLAVLGNPTSRTYDLYFQPARRESGRTYQVSVFMADGSIMVFRVVGGLTIPRLSLMVARLRARR
ncbi:MAG: hypothetical protein U0800_11445 [Isosphaeraceae bacterium]